MLLPKLKFDRQVENDPFRSQYGQMGYYLLLRRPLSHLHDRPIRTTKEL